MARKIIFYRDYFKIFFNKQSEKTKQKIDYVLDLIANVERVPEMFLKHLEGTKGLYEIRVQYGGNIYRLFCCFDSGNALVILNCFQKKSQKTPAKEVNNAKKIMEEYFSEKIKNRLQ